MLRPFPVIIAFLMTLSITEIVSAREKTGLVLSGGGARGFAHVAVLEALEANQVQIDYIAGTSMGAVVGALYASGLSAAEVREKLLAVGQSSWPVYGVVAEICAIQSARIPTGVATASSHTDCRCNVHVGQ